MQQYTEFASVYDLFMDNVPYDEWTDYVDHILKKQKVEKGLVLELGCGTGSMTTRLADKGYDMIGIDASEEMLSVARENNEGRENEILYLCQDMREFELYGTVSAVISVCDSMNYILTEEDLLKVFQLVNNYLDPGGIFLFDLDTRYAYEEVLGDTTIAENREEGSFIWENTYYPEEMINEINLTLFLPEDHNLRKASQSDRINPNGIEENIVEEDAPIYRKYEETHYRKAYTIDTVKRLIEEAGMEWIAVYDALSEKQPKKDSERVYILAKEKHQEGKLYL